jgi:hypothetical protein
MAGSFQLIDLTSNIAFTFQYFPREIRGSDRANWEQQETTIGVKPLFYSNRDPRQISLQEMYLDNSDTNLSLNADLQDLRSLMVEIDSIGTPPPLLALWGESQLRCVLQELSIEECLFNDEGNCIRAKIDLTLLQLQEEGEATTVTVQDDPVRTEDPFGL